MIHFAGDCQSTAVLISDENNLMMHSKGTARDFQLLIPFSSLEQIEDNLKQPHMKHVNGGHQVIDNCFDFQVHFYCSSLLAKVDMTYKIPCFCCHVTVQYVNGKYLCFSLENTKVLSSLFWAQVPRKGSSSRWLVLCF